MLLWNRTLLTLIIVSGLSQLAECEAGAPPQELVKKLTEVIRAQRPDAQIEVTDEGLVAKSQTMMFTVHGRFKTGVIATQPHQVEGPNADGFRLQIQLNEGRYRGAAVVPQTLQEPYYPVFVDASPTSDGKGHYWISFAYGSRLDPQIKQAILDAIPRTRFPNRKSPALPAAGQPMSAKSSPRPANGEQSVDDTEFTGLLNVHPKFLYRYYLVLQGSNGQTCALFESENGNPQVLPGIKPGSLVRVKGRLHIRAFEGGTSSDPSPFSKGTIIALDVRQVDVLRGKDK